MKYDPEEFLQKQAEIENVDLKNPSEYEPAPEILAVYTDYVRMWIILYLLKTNFIEIGCPRINWPCYYFRKY